MELFVNQKSTKDCILKEAIETVMPVVLQTNGIWDSQPSIVTGSEEEGYIVWYSMRCSMPLDMNIVTDIKVASQEYDKQSLEEVACKIVY